MSQVRTESSIIDLNILIDMYGDDSHETLRGALSGFATAAPPYIDTIKKAGLSGDLGKLASAAHSLKSIAALTGATSLANICQHLEEDARDGNTDKVAILLLTLPECWQQLQQQLQQKLLQIGSIDV